MENTLNTTLSEMSFLPAIPLSAVPAYSGSGVAVNLDGILLASVVSGRHCKNPGLACFVNRNGADTVLISDWGNDRVVEVTVSGLFLRAIALKNDSGPWGIAYCAAGDVIAVSLYDAHAVVLLQYESGAGKPEVTGTGAAGRGDGQLRGPMGVFFTADGRYILVADCFNHRVGKFSVASGAFLAHVATNAANGIWYPRNVLQCEDGSIVVAQGVCDGSLVFVGEDGATVQNIIIPSPSGGVSIPVFISFSSLWNGLVVKTNEGQVFFVRDAWSFSSRCAWISALTIS
jgi:DNA-binding beta-propeller fold protein YncE